MSNCPSIACIVLSRMARWFRALLEENSTERKQTKRTGIAAFVLAFALDTQAVQAAWGLSCEDDPIEDLRTCHLSDGEVTVIGIVFDNGERSEFVTVGYNKFPGSDIVFRVDQNAVIRWPDNETTGRSRELIQQMIKGRRLLSRYTQWPYKTTVDGTTNLTGFSQKLNKMRERLDEYVRR